MPFNSLINSPPIENSSLRQSLPLTDEASPPSFPVADFDGLSADFAVAIKDKKGGEHLQKLVQLAEAVDGVADNETAGAWLKCFKSLAKQADPRAYLEKETKRLTTMVSSSAITAAKKKDMSGKLACLNVVSSRVQVEDKEEEL